MPRIISEIQIGTDLIRIIKISWSDRLILRSGDSKVLFPYLFWRYEVIRAVDKDGIIYGHNHHSHYFRLKNASRRARELREEIQRARELREEIQ